LLLLQQGLDVLPSGRLLLLLLLLSGLLHSHWRLLRLLHSHWRLLRLLHTDWLLLLPCSLSLGCRLD
jgi:hypothetical protein